MAADCGRRVNWTPNLSPIRAENPFPQPQRLYTIANDFGSWEELSKTFFAEQTGIVTQLLAELGKS